MLRIATIHNPHLRPSLYPILTSSECRARGLVPGEPHAGGAEPVQRGLDPPRPPREPVSAQRCQPCVRLNNTCTLRPRRHWRRGRPALGWGRRWQGGGRAPPETGERRKVHGGGGAAQGAEMAVLCLRGIGGRDLLRAQHPGGYPPATVQRVDGPHVHGPARAAVGSITDTPGGPTPHPLGATIHTHSLIVHCSTVFPRYWYLGGHEQQLQLAHVRLDPQRPRLRGVQSQVQNYPLHPLPVPPALSSSLESAAGASEGITCTHRTACRRLATLRCSRAGCRWRMAGKQGGGRGPGVVEIMGWVVREGRGLSRGS